jgi:hypothetical protein
MLFFIVAVVIGFACHTAIFGNCYSSVGIVNMLWAGIVRNVT